MTQQKLQKELEQLRAEIEKVDTTDAQTKTKLEQLVRDIENELEKPEKDEVQHGLMDDLRESINRFEAEHPRTTAILNDIMVTLSNMGI
ncbi:MAG TPA: DUF4404 family protein [Gammaproteobacteria bacterium]|nr:DUF4404 family protein [Gammaproteobacteria bacterium]